MTFEAIPSARRAVRMKIFTARLPCVVGQVLGILNDLTYISVPVSRLPRLLA